MKYLVLILSVIASIIFVRIQAAELGKAMYFEGCSDSALKLARLGKIVESKQVEMFCDSQKQVLDQYLSAF
jgi:hypothetical protein